MIVEKMDEFNQPVYQLQKVTMSVAVQTGTLLCAEAIMGMSRAEAYDFMLGNLHECLAHAEVTVIVGEGADKQTHCFTVSPLRYCSQAVRNFRDELKGR